MRIACKEIGAALNTLLIEIDKYLLSVGSGSDVSRARLYRFNGTVYCDLYYSGRGEYIEEYEYDQKTMAFKFHAKREHRLRAAKQ